MRRLVPDAASVKMPVETDASLARLARRSVEIIRAGQAPSGAYLASPTLPVYRYAWLRDGAFVADAMSRVGETGSADAFFSWCARVVEGYQERITSLVRRASAGDAPALSEFPHVRLTADGAETADGWWNFQLDAYGAWLWALGEHRARGAVPDPSPLTPAVETTARYLNAFWKRRCYSCWEEDPDRVHVSTLGAIAGGLRAAVDWPGIPDDVRIQSEQTMQELAGAARAAACAGRLGRALDDCGLDASLLFCVVPFRLVPFDDPLARATVEAVERELARPEGGVHRYLEDRFYGGGEWPILAAALGLCHLVLGDPARARRQLDWIADQANRRGELPEQVEGHLLHPSARPEWVARWGRPARALLWSHAMYLHLFSALLESESAAGRQPGARTGLPLRGAPARS